GGFDAGSDGSATFGFYSNIDAGVLETGAVGRLTADGKVDSQFGVGHGWAITPDLNGQGETPAPGPILLQPDGKIIFLGSNESTLGDLIPPIALARLGGDGTIDTSFGTAGQTLIDQSTAGSFTGYADAALLRDGSILVLGVHDQQAQVARYW